MGSTKERIATLKKIIMRKRNHAITIRMEQKEYDLMNKRIKESGQTKQAFIIGSVLGSKIANREGILPTTKILSDFSITLAKLRKEETENCQLIRQLISAQLPMVL